jgi:hypothetical protein
MISAPCKGVMKVHTAQLGRSADVTARAEEMQRATAASVNFMVYVCVVDRLSGRVECLRVRSGSFILASIGGCSDVRRVQLYQTLRAEQDLEEGYRYRRMQES